ncbi:ABC transporter ATP-binding protein [Halomarina salina]|uniref:ABC transporter ATP-binding protein n=1 Tax=Halomarina salina TaxID=1872699 RepID=A0ABD5RKN1_9EURY|nr:ABC transporter ATP-binding protein [Halomarina salina]
MSALELRSLQKRYGDVVALRDVDLTVRRGEVFGFLGPNGAGKSTTIDIVLDYVRPTDGSARVFGHDAQEEGERVRERVGALPDMRLFGHLTARQHVQFVADAKGSDDDPVALLERVGLGRVVDFTADGFSTGMGQRLKLAMALVGDPDLLVLDEPSAGLDPNGAREMRRIVREENARGATVFFSSHILEQVEAVCDRVGILSDGEVVAEDSIDDLREATGARSSFVVTVDDLSEVALAAVRDVAGVAEATVDGTSVTVTCPDDRKAAVVDAVRTDGATVLDIDSEDASLERLFATYTGGR